MLLPNRSITTLNFSFSFLLSFSFSFSRSRRTFLCLHQHRRPGHSARERRWNKVRHLDHWYLTMPDSDTSRRGFSADDCDRFEFHPEEEKEKKALPIRSSRTNSALIENNKRCLNDLVIISAETSFAEHCWTAGGQRWHSTLIYHLRVWTLMITSARNGLFIARTRLFTDVSDEVIGMNAEWYTYPIRHQPCLLSDNMFISLSLAALEHGLVLICVRWSALKEIYRLIKMSLEDGVLSIQIWSSFALSHAIWSFCRIESPPSPSSLWLRRLGFLSLSYVIHSFSEREFDK